MRSPFLGGLIYASIGWMFVLLAIQQHERTGQWDLITILLIALAAFDFMVAFRYFSYKGKRKQ